MKQLLLHAGVSKMTLALLDNDVLSDLAVEYAGEEDIVGRVYRGVIKNVVPSLNGMFIDIGIGRNAFLRAKDISSNEPHTEGRAVLVQVEKDSTETKGPLVTEKISFAGEYAVALTDTEYIGISKKIQDESKRRSLRNYARDIYPAGIGLIVRTAAENAKEEDFKKDITTLVNNMTTVKRRFKLGKEPALLYRDGDLLVRSIRDYMMGQDIESFIVDDKDAYDRLCQLAEGMDPGLADKILLYKERENLLRHFCVEEQISQLFSRVVPLSNGGSLVIDYTEALTVIDVNSGSFRGNKIPHEELAFLINKAAAYEIARQIRLRGIGGIIMIDFIDMKKKKEQYELLDILRAAVRSDRVKTVVCGMTSLGLVEITRKRTKHRIWEYYFDSCPVCHGTGRILSAKSVADNIMEELKNRRSSGPLKNDLEIRCNTEVAHILKQTESELLLKNIVGRSVVVTGEPSFAREVYTLLSI